MQPQKQTEERMSAGSSIFSTAIFRKENFSHWQAVLAEVRSECGSRKYSFIKWKRPKNIIRRR